MKELYTLGKEYLETAEQLKHYAKKTQEKSGDVSLQEHRLLLSKVAEFRKTATVLQKYGTYLCKYYERGKDL